jgi:hypothetical protein
MRDVASQLSHLSKCRGLVRRHLRRNFSPQEIPSVAE